MCGRSTFCMLCETFCHVEDNILSETCTCACRVDRAKEAIIIACHPQINLFIFLFLWFQCNMCLHYCCFVIHCALSIYVYECVRRRLFSYSCCFDICRSYRMLTQSLDVYYTIQDQHSLLRYVFGLLRKPVLIFVSEYSAIYIEHKRKEFLWYFETLCSRNLDCWTMSSTTYFFHYFISIIIAKQLKMVFPPLVLMAGNHLFWFIHL